MLSVKEITSALRANIKRPWGVSHPDNRRAARALHATCAFSGFLRPLTDRQLAGRMHLVQEIPLTVHVHWALNLVNGVPK